MTAVIEAFGAAVPDRVVRNADLEASLHTTDAWVRTRTGIAERRVAEAGVATGDLAREAGGRALKAAGGGAVDLVVVATTSPDRLIPATAPEVAEQLGFGGVAAFDLNAACSGFVYALATAAALLEVATATRALVIGADTLTRLVDPTDRDTAVLFGDGAGAAVVHRGDPGEPGAVHAFDLGSDGQGADLLAVPAGGSRRPADVDSVAERAHFLRMDGRQVYRQAVAGMTASSRRSLDAAGLAAHEVDWLVGHQANARILGAVAANLGVPAERCALNIERYGNTSAASIPLALAELPAAPGDRVLLTAFGAGFTWASAVLAWPHLPDKEHP